MTFWKAFKGKSTAGRAADLGDTWYRSMWERNFARFLRFTGEPFEYEARVFWFPVKRGTVSYKPDFKSLSKPHTWYEVKGFLDSRSRVALERMRRYFPEEKVILIDRNWFADAHRKGLHKLIPNWETLRKRQLLGQPTINQEGRDEQVTRRIRFDGGGGDAGEQEGKDEGGSGS